MVMLLQSMLFIIVTGTQTPVLDEVPAGQSDWISSRKACCAVKREYTNVNDGNTCTRVTATQTCQLHYGNSVAACFTRAPHTKSMQMTWPRGRVWHFGRSAHLLSCGELML